MRTVLAGPNRAIFNVWPTLAAQIPFADLGVFPTKLTSLGEVLRSTGIRRDDVFVKRDDQSAPLYGGNKIRTLEVLFGQALRQGATEIWATGSYGSNHALATAIHAPRVGLKPGAILFPQPHTHCAKSNVLALIAADPMIRAISHWSALPWNMIATFREERARGEQPVVMKPGGATPEGAMGYVSAAIELAQQVHRGQLPAPSRIVVGVGSNCTCAGLLVGSILAARLQIGFEKPPKLIAVRASPWPVTSAYRIVELAHRTAKHLATLTSDRALRIERSELHRYLDVDGRFLGKGYGYPTPPALEAMALWRDHVGWELDTTHSGKSAAAFLQHARTGTEGPIVFWSTKSSLSLPTPSPSQIDCAPVRVKRWLDSPMEHESIASGKKR